MMRKLIFSICCIVLTFPLTFFAQKIDSVETVQRSLHKNVIKFNPTPMILWSWKNVTFSYERILSPRQSISFELGYLVFPKLINDNIVDLVNISGQTEITGNLDGSQIQQINEALYDKLITRFPGITAFSTTGKTFQQNGKLDVFRMGFRYLVQIGFHF